MSVLALILGETAVKLWGLSSRERLHRQLREIGGVDILQDSAGTDAVRPVLLINGNYLFEINTLKGILDQPGCVLIDNDRRPAAAWVSHQLLDVASKWLTGYPSGCEPGSEPGALAKMRRLTVTDIAAFDEELRRAKNPLLEPIELDQKDRLESMLYGNAYRGITDLVTKFVWPRPARVVVRWCATLGLSPNLVTSVGFVLVIAASWLFLQGDYAAGLLAGWIMTFLDTVDGKLARVTIQSSRLGHWLDHGIDILHPPFWYIFWGMSLSGFSPIWGVDLPAAYWLIVLAYIAGRAVEGLFPMLGDCTIFTWRPFDAWFRLVTARRNPCLIILTLAVVAGRPDWGFVGVAGWSLLTSAVLILRIGQAALHRLRHGRLQSWLSDMDQAAQLHPLSYGVFGSTRGAYA